MTLTVVILLYLVGVGLLAAEVFVPGGVLGVIGFIIAMTSITLAFIKHGPVPGSCLTAASVGIGYGLLRLSLGRMTLAERQTPEQGYVAVDPGLPALVGKSGVTETPLRPVGTARIEGEPVTVQTRGDFIERGAAITVIETRGAAVFVARSPAENRRAARDS